MFHYLSCSNKIILLFKYRAVRCVKYIVDSHWVTRCRKQLLHDRCWTGAEIQPCSSGKQVIKDRLDQLIQERPVTLICSAVDVLIITPAFLVRFQIKGRWDEHKITNGTDEVLTSGILLKRLNLSAGTKGAGK